MWSSTQEAIHHQGGNLKKKLLSYLAPTKVNVNGTEYMGSVAVNDKKKAKANAAMYCLQTMGLVPKDPDNPV